MKRSILAALLITVLTAPAAHGQAKLLKPEPIGNDVAPTTSEPPQLPPPSPRSATLGPPTSIPIPVPFSPEVPATGPPHQLKGREPAHGTKTAGVPDLLPPPKVLTVPQAMPEPVINGPQGRFWTEVDGLAWWVQSDKGPPALVTTGPGGAVLAGGREFNYDAQPGIRVTTGYWFDYLQTTGIQAGGFWLDNANHSSAFVSDGSATLARPFVNSATGMPSGEFVALPGVSSGAVVVSTHTSFDGWDVALRQLVCDGCNARIDGVVGFRQLRLADQLGIGEESDVLGAGGPRGLPAGSQLLVQDHFDTVNEFYGAEFGFEGEYRYRGWTLEGMVKLAAGWDVTHVNINGASFITLPNQPTTASTGGLLALPSNIGVYRRTDITLIPEVGVNLAYDLTSNIRIRAGYDFLYWEHVNRPGQQIDTNVNTNLIPPGPGGQPARPTETIAGTDLFVHGVIFGVELRY